MSWTVHFSSNRSLKMSIDLSVIDPTPVDMDIYALIDHVPAPSQEEQDSLQHELTPNISRKAWNKVGDKINVVEHAPVMMVPHDKVFTLRLDIKNMGTHKKGLEALGILSRGWNEDFASSMVDVSQILAREYRATYVYTQSDEITLIVAPGANPLYEHRFNGKRDKLVSESAALASVLFNRLFRESLMLDDEEPLPLITFDSRLGQWNSLREAFELILWRAYDCSVNSVSDAVHNLHKTIPINKHIMDACTKTKLLYLQQHGVLPLALHQAHGSLIVRRAQNDTIVYEVVLPRKSVVNMVKEKLLL